MLNDLGQFRGNRKFGNAEHESTRIGRIFTNENLPLAPELFVLDLCRCTFV
jgi:hypothetical protein